jgi:hypothetical protein
MSIREQLMEAETITDRNKRLVFRDEKKAFDKANPIKKNTYKIVDKSFQGSPTVAATKERQNAQELARIQSYDAAEANPETPTDWSFAGNKGKYLGSAAVAAGIGALALAKKLRAKKKAAAAKKAKA